MLDTHFINNSTSPRETESSTDPSEVDDPTDDIWPFEKGTVIEFSTPFQGGMYAKVCKHVSTESVKYRYPQGTIHTLGALEGRLFLHGIVAEGNYKIVEDPFKTWEESVPDDEAIDKLDYSNQDTLVTKL